MSRSENRELTNMCMLRREDGKILVQMRKKDDRPGLCFPGGHLEKGESATASVIIEFKEETGITIKNPRLCGLKHRLSEKFGRYPVFCFMASEYKGKIASSEEGDVFRLNESEIGVYRLSNSFDKMLQLFLNEEVNEYFIDEDPASEEIY